MADKPEYVDMISEATRQVRRRYAPRVEEAEGQGKAAAGPLAAGAMGAVAAEKFMPWKLKPWD